MLKGFWALVLVAFVAAVGYAFLRPEPTTQDLMLAKCEEVFLQRLKSPSSYKRIEVTELRTRPATLDEHLGIFDPAQKAEYDRRLKDPRMGARFRELDEADRARFAAVPHDFLTFLVSYDADNAFGTALRGAFECSTVAESGQPLSEFFTAYVDGHTALSWAMQGLSG